MKQLKSYLYQPVSAAPACALLIFCLLACSFQRADRRPLSNNGSTNDSRKTADSGRFEREPDRSRYPDNSVNPRDGSEYDSENSGGDYSETDDSPSDRTAPTSNASTAGFYIGRWSVSSPNGIGGFSLSINDDETYSWNNGFTGDSFTGKWESDGANLILKKGYKDVDWQVRRAGDAAQDMIFISENGAGMASVFYRGTRAE